MKTYFFILAFILSLGTSCKSDKEIVLPLHNKRVLILGNSITQQGDYVDFIEYYLRTKYPSNQLDIISIGLSGETISGTSDDGGDYPRPNVRERLDNALNTIKPDLVLACYGMNDGNYHPYSNMRFHNYRNGILELKSKVEAHGAQLILLTPTVFDPNPIEDRVSKEGETHTYWHPYYNYNEVLTTYSDWLLSIENNDVQVIDLHHHLNSVLTDIRQIKSDSTFVPDGVHPNKIGHFYMAQKVLNDLYSEVSIENPVSEIEHLKTDSLFKLISKRREIRSEGWRNYIGFIKNGDTVKTEDISTTKSEMKQLDEAIAKLLNQ